VRKVEHVEGEEIQRDVVIQRTFQISIATIHRIVII